MNKKGFMLIELLVVIAIIGLLSTIAIVAVDSVRQKQWLDQCADGNKESCKKLDDMDVKKAQKELGISPLNTKCEEEFLDCKNSCTYSNDNLETCLEKCNIRYEYCLNK